MLGLHHIPQIKYSILVASEPQTQSNLSQQSVDTLARSIQTLADRLNQPPREEDFFNWTRPATHFIDSLPGYNSISLFMVLVTTVILCGFFIFAWFIHKRGLHQNTILQALSVPLTAFTELIEQQTSMAQRHTVDFDTLGRRIETMGERIATMGESVDRLNVTLGHIVVVEHTAAEDTRTRQSHPRRTATSV